MLLFFANYCRGCGQVSNLCRSQGQLHNTLRAYKEAAACVGFVASLFKLYCRALVIKSSARRLVCILTVDESYINGSNIIFFQELVSVMLPHPQLPQSCSPCCKKVWVGWPQSYLRINSVLRSNQNAKCTGLRRIYSMTVQWCLTAYRRLCRKHRGWCY